MIKSKGFAPIAILIIIIVSLVVASAMIILPKEEISQKETEQSVEDDDESNWQWVNNQNKLYELTPAEVDLILKEVQKRFSDKAERLKVLSVLRLGTPYQLGCLGEESGRDKDPIFRLDVTDCTAFVLTNIALLHSQNLDEAREMMKFLNYRQENEITFENRLHFTTDRNITSPYFQDITEQVAGSSKIREKKVILNKIKTDGERLIDINWEKEIVLKYIHSEYIDQMFLNKLPQAAGIALFREGDAKIGLDVAHEGFLFEGKDFIHSSSVQEKVAEVNFLDYYFDSSGNARFDGIILFEVK